MNIFLLLWCLLFPPTPPVCHLYSPNVVIWQNGDYQVLSEGSELIRGNRFYLPGNGWHVIGGNTPLKKGPP